MFRKVRKSLGGCVIWTVSGRLKVGHPFCNVIWVYRVNVLKLVSEIHVETPKAEVTRYGGPITCIGGCTNQLK